jgi:hypothetical protein
MQLVTFRVDMHRLLIILILFFPVFAVSAQTLKGIIAGGDDGKPLYPVTVINVVTQESTYSNEQGEFSIRAKTGEEIIFSFLGYTTVRRSMPATLGIATMRVEMLTQNYKLNEVVIRPGYTNYQLDSIRRHSTYERTLARQKTTSIMSPVSLLAESISGKSRQLYHFQKNFNKWESERFIDSRYTAELVTKLTRLTGDSLGNFMLAYPMPYDYARTATELEIEMWIRYNYKQWLHKPKEDILQASQTTE